jgi:hypothetical protein
VHKAIFKADSSKGGFIRSTIAPVNDRKEPGFGAWDAMELTALVFSVLLVMRYLVR